MRKASLFALLAAFSLTVAAPVFATDTAPAPTTETKKEDKKEDKATNKDKKGTDTKTEKKDTTK